MDSVLTEDFAILAQSGLPFADFRGRTFLITGATGLVGSLLVKALLYCNQVHQLNLRIFALVRSEEKARQIYGSLLSDPALTLVYADLSKEGPPEGLPACDFIVHAAAVTTSKIMVSDPVGTIRTAVEGTDRMLQFAAAHRCQSFVYISSMEIYGQPLNPENTVEKDLGYVDLSAVRSCYPESKRMCECLCTAYASEYGLNVTCARLAQTFGAGILASENRVFAQFARSAIEGKDIVLHTTGESEGNYVYTRDAVSAILTLLLYGKKGEAYNIANEESHVTIRGMAELVAEKIAGGAIRVTVEIPEDSAQLGYAPKVRMRLDASRMRALGWKAEVGLLDSYRRMIRWMRS